MQASHREYHLSCTETAVESKVLVTVNSFSEEFTEYWSFWYTLFKKKLDQLETTQKTAKTMTFALGILSYFERVANACLTLLKRRRDWKHLPSPGGRISARHSDVEEHTNEGKWNAITLLTPSPLIPALLSNHFSWSGFWRTEGMNRRRRHWEGQCNAY